MNRAMFSGVAGLKTHQTKMDVIGNNIANVNTYGYKSQRAVFSDIYYQTLRGASEGSSSRGGQNPSMIGYGSSLSGVQTQMSQSSSQNTGFGLDVSIAGEGYLQVMDGDGNIYYTRAGMLDYDSQGYLVDINGNFVLGTSATGKPGKEKIRLDAIGAADSVKPSVTEDVNGIKYTITASKTSRDGNVSFTIHAGEGLPIGERVQATISGSNIDIALNPLETFTSMDDLNNAINDAITKANNGVQHNGGIFTISTDKTINFGDGLTGAEITGTTYGYNKGGIDLGSKGIFGGFTVAEVGNGFAPADGKKITFSLSRSHDAEKGDTFTITAQVEDGATYTGTITQSQMNAAGKVVLKNGDSTTDTITMTFPSYSTVMNAGTLQPDAWSDFTVDTDEAVTKLQNGKLFGGFTVNTFPKGATGLEKYGDLIDGSFSLDYDAATGEYTMEFTKDGETYTGAFTKNDYGKTVALKTAAGDALVMNVPTYDDILSSVDTNKITYGDQNVLPTEITPSTPSKDLGLSSLTFSLSGGTEGGTITLDQLTSISIGADGTISVTHPDKGTVTAGKISLVTFANPSGLAQAGTNYFTETVNSGKPVYAEPGTNGTGSLKSSSLEMSNVDLSQEFAEMITTQRGFQANSRIITVSDTMLEELINLKR